MKASPSSTSEDDEAENDTDEPLVFDYADFFSTLMYYAHMSKDEILDHSRAFLHGIYRMYYKRACENLGVSDKPKDDDEEEPEQEAFFPGQYELRKDDYPTEFYKLPPKPNKPIDSSPEKTREFLASFGAGAQVFNNVQIAKDG